MPELALFSLDCSIGLVTNVSELWIAIIVASLLVYSWKLIGTLLPQQFLEHPLVSRTAALLTVALMAGLIGVQGFVGSNGEPVIDARFPALLVAGILAWRRTPFIVIVIVAAAVAAALRAFGWN